MSLYIDEPTSEPTSKPTTSEPTSAQPTTSKPTTSEPTTGQPTECEPVCESCNELDIAFLLDESQLMRKNGII